MVIITPKAAEKLKGLIAEENKGTNIPQTAGLRLYVQDRDCSGFQYGLMIEKEPTENDNIVESTGFTYTPLSAAIKPDQHDNVFMSNGILVFVDHKSLVLVDGTEIDYSNNLFELALTTPVIAAITAKNTRNLMTFNLHKLLPMYLIFCRNIKMVVDKNFVFWIRT